MKIMDNTDKQITLIAKQIVERKIAKCGRCEGIGDYDDAPDGSSAECIIPCPTCADLRKLAGELCTEPDKLDKYDEHIPCSNCGLTHHASQKSWYIQTLRKLLTRMGEWEGFVDYAAFEYLIWKQCKTCNSSHSPSVSVYPIAGILTSDELMAQAVLEYFKGVLNG